MTTEAATVTSLPTTERASAVTAFTERDQFELDLRKAKVFAASTLVPTQYQDNLPNCLIALNMAKRIGADALMVCQNLHVVQGKPGWSGQFLIASFNQCGRFTAMRFEWKGAEGAKDWGCRAYATEKSTGELIKGAWVTWKMVEAEGWSKKNGSKWLTMPEQMFHYRAAAFLVRAFAPEIAMGLQTVEELVDVIDVTPTNGEPAATKLDAVKNALRDRVGPETPVADAPLADDKIPPTFAELADAMQKAADKDGVDLAESLVDGAIKDGEQRAELHAIAKQQREALADLPQ